MRQFMNITRALADENRVRMLLALKRGGELCVCQITELFGLAPSTVSKHLSILHQAGLAESRKAGRWIYYRLPGRNAEPAVRRAIEWVAQSINGEPRVAEDHARLKKVLAMDPAELCRRQCGK
jgi:ArsR family transcriptional regulator